MLLYQRDGRLVKVEGDSDNPFNRGRLCIRGTHLREFLEHPSRLRHPLLRTGNRGENHWKQIRYEEAIRIASQKLLETKQKYGAESVIFCKGTARDIGGWLPRLCYGFGSPNYFGLGPGNGNACYRPRVAASTAIMGGTPVADLGQFVTEGGFQVPRCVLNWGCNPVHSNPDGMHGGWVTDLLKQGTQLVVVDLQRTGLAAKARVWLRPKPGTDGAVALGMIQVMFREDLIDRDFCREWTVGSEELRKTAQGYTPERTAALTGIKAEDIITAARFFAQAKPANIIWGVGVDMHPGCLGTIHGLIALMALSGNIENPGGMVLPGDPFGVRRRGDDLHDFPQITTRRIGAEEYPLIEVGNPYGQPDVLLDQMESGHPYPLKAAWVQGTSIIPSSFADPARVLRLFGNLDFTVMTDVFMNPAAVAFADLVFPAAMYPEKNSLFVHTSQLGAINKAVEPPGECRADAQIILDVGRLVAPQYFPWKDTAEWIDERLKPAGMTFAKLKIAGSMVPKLEYAKHTKGMLRNDGLPGFETPTGKIELKASIFAKMGLADLPYHDDCVERYQQLFNRGKYPFILSTGARKPYYFCAEGRQVESLRRLQPQPQATLHPLDAQELGILEGEEIRIFSPFGSCIMEARISEGFDSGVIHCDFGWWFPEREAASPSFFDSGKANVNALLPSGLQGPSGMGYPFRAFICNVEKIKE